MARSVRYTLNGCENVSRENRCEYTHCTTSPAMM